MIVSNELKRAADSSLLPENHNTVARFFFDGILSGFKATDFRKNSAAFPKSPKRAYSTPICSKRRKLAGSALLRSSRLSSAALPWGRPIEAKATQRNKRSVKR